MVQSKIMVSRRHVISTGLAIVTLAVIGAGMASGNIASGLGNGGENSLYPADADDIDPHISLRWSIASVQIG